MNQAFFTALVFAESARARTRLRLLARSLTVAAVLVEAETLLSCFLEAARVVVLDSCSSSLQAAQAAFGAAASCERMFTFGHKDNIRNLTMMTFPTIK